jgi:Mg2+ and Co2+ transporter CorA
MANPVLAELEKEVASDVTVMGSATTLINGFASRQQAAIDAALANGATAEQLAPVQSEVDALKAGATALSAAVVANTPPPAPAP